MEEMLLLDKRTKNLIEDYVPKGDVLEGIVCFFFCFFGLYARENFIGAGNQRALRNGYVEVA